MTQTNAVLGTPAYMSPEQARGEARNVTTAADVYGLGAIFYETLTGSPPFGGGSSLETIRQVLDEEPVRPSMLNGGVDRDLETICLKCLEKEAARRYGSAREFSSDLERWLRHEPIEARPVQAWERLWKWARRKPAIASIRSGRALVLVLGLAGILWQWQRAEHARRKAEAEASTSQQIADFLKEMLDGSNPWVALGRDATLLQEILDRSAGRIGATLTNDLAVRADLLFTIGGAYAGIGNYKPQRNFSAKDWIWRGACQQPNRLSWPACSTRWVGLYGWTSASMRLKRPRRKPSRCFANGAGPIIRITHFP